MVFFNYATMQMAAKIVYYGPGLCGKTTNLHVIYGRTAPTARGEMVSLETETDRTLFFDLLPIDVGVIGGFKTRLQLYTVPGQVFYNTTRKLVLKGVDGIVFVADSQRPMLEPNKESFRNLRENLAEIGVRVEEVPLVLQYNKRDLANILTVEELGAALNPDGVFESFEASAANGTGVFETLKGISKLTLRALRSRMSGDVRRPAVFAAPATPAPSLPAPSGEAARPASGDDAAHGTSEVRSAPPLRRPSIAFRDSPSWRANRRPRRPRRQPSPRASRPSRGPTPNRRPTQRPRSRRRPKWRPGPNPRRRRAPLRTKRGPRSASANRPLHLPRRLPSRPSSTSRSVRASTSSRSSTSSERSRPRGLPPDRDPPLAPNRGRPRASGASIDDLLASNLNHKKDVTRSFDLTIPRQVLGRSRQVTIELKFSDGSGSPLLTDSRFSIDLSSSVDLQKLLLSLRFNVQAE